MTSESFGHPDQSQPSQDAFVHFLMDDQLWNVPLSKSLHTVARFCAEHLNVSRVGIWLLEDSDQRLVSKILYDRNKPKTGEIISILAEDHPKYFNALMHQRVICSENASTNPITASFNKDYLRPLQIASMLDATIHKVGKTIGVLCAEHCGQPRSWQPYEINLITSIADLVTQLLTNNALDESEERYRKVFDSTPDAVILMQDRAMVDCNQSALDLFLCTREEFEARSPQDFWAETQSDGVATTEHAKRIIEQALQGVPQHYEWRHRKLNGDVFDTEVSLNQISLNNEPHFVACIRDISERKQAENRISQLLSMQQAIFDGASYCIIASDLNGSIQTFNRAAEALTGWRADEVIGQHSVLSFHDQNELKWRATELSEELGEPVTADFSVLSLLPSRGKTDESEWRWTRKDGSRVPVMLSVSALKQEQQGVTGYVVIASDLTERKETHKMLAHSRKKMEYRAYHDELTGLPNRSMLHHNLGLAITNYEDGQMIVLMLIDLDRFKEVNDTLGHATGDSLLQKIGMRLNKIAREQGGRLYRLGGDEFAVLYPQPDSQKAINHLAENIHLGLRSPMQVEGISLELGGSLGISIYPTHGEDSHSLLRCADVAMYKAKAESLRSTTYEEALDTHSPRRLSMISQLGAAIRDNQLILHFQPKIRLSDNACIGCEALVRWQHPEHGMVPPGEFIPLAEMSDLIQPLGISVLESALLQIRIWLEKGLHIPIAVNLSTRNLLDSAFPQLIQSQLEKYEIPSNLLEIEITESTLIGDPERALHIINLIHNQGVAFAIDDFGTGYSSMAYLKRLPINTLKIDRSFIRDMLTDGQDKMIVQSTLGLAHSFGLDVVAEGVEDQETLDELRQLGCEHAQGFLISRPVPAYEFEQWLSQHKPSPPSQSQNQ